MFASHMMATRALLLAVSFLATLSRGQDNNGLILDYDTAVTLAQLPLECYQQEYPHKYGLTFTSTAELHPPSEIHPTFHGCFDWHSSVHGHWMLVALANKFPDTELEQTVIGVMDQQLTADKILAEVEVFNDDDNPEFERTYGWAWLLKLYIELKNSPHDQDKGWSTNLEPLATRIADLYAEYLPDLLYPIRVGEHPNTAFGLIFALEYAEAISDSGFASQILDRASFYYGADVDCPLDPWEPSGNDFLSPCLQEGDLQRWIDTDPDTFGSWLEAFVPLLFDPTYHLEPGHVSNGSDGKLVHLHGLNFSRAWNLYNMLISLPSSMQSDRLNFLSMADEHILESQDDVVDSEYSGSHWLATFLVEALLRREVALQVLASGGKSE